MDIRELLIEANSIQVCVDETNWKRVIKIAAEPLINGGYIKDSYAEAVIENTLQYGPYYVFDEGIAIPHARPESGVIKNCFSIVLLKEPIRFSDSSKVDIVVMFGASDSKSHIEDGIQTIIGFLDNDDVMCKLRNAKSSEEVMALL